MKRRRLLTKTTVLVAVAALTLTSGTLYSRPLPPLEATTISQQADSAASSAKLDWPSFGQSAVGTIDSGLLAASTAKEQPLPTASVAKLMTALVVLDKKPLAKGASGPELTIGDADMAIYDQYFRLGGSLARVEFGEKINQYDALQAVLLPSANNIADMLANWAFGSVDAYAKYANAYAKKHGLEHTNIADASGFSPNTTSTASDLVKLGALALQNPVITEIAAKRTSEIPVAGTIYNVNGLLGRYGINGLKTGNTEQAGGVFLVSANRQLADGNTTTVIAAVMGGPDLETSMRSSLPLLDGVVNNMTVKTIVKKGQSFGTYTAPWDDVAVTAVATKDISAMTWTGTQIRTTANMKPLRGPQTKGTDAGTLTVDTGKKTEIVPLVLANDIAAPSGRWRVTRF
jgi:D-alanyl-D-alanine carboxypeptidase (penicillin-binding protein 5/6)